jgi:hypothetical protein
MKPQTPEAFEAAARATIQEKETFIENLHAVIAAQESQLAKWSESPDSKSFEEILQAEIEVVARKNISERIKRNYRAENELQRLLNTTQSAEVLKAFLAEKTKVIASLKSQIAPIRKKALEAEEAGRDEEAFSKNQEADNLAVTVSAYEINIQHAGEALRRSSTNYQNTIGFLHQIAA